MPAFIDLPKIQFTDYDVQSILDKALNSLQNKTGKVYSKADPDRILFLALMDQIIQLRVLIDREKKADLLPYARRVMLDYLGTLYGVVRLPAAAATTQLRFNLSTQLSTASTVPGGTRVGVQNGDGTIFFITNQAIIIPPGAMFGMVEATANVTGEVGNGFTVGQVNTLMDPLAFVANVTNTTLTGGGAETETDDAFRERIRIAPESFSTAGPRDAYIYWAKTASASIIDVGLDSPAPYEAVVVPLLTGGNIPGQEILDAVYESVSARNRRPLTDLVKVQAPKEVSYDIDVTFYISSASTAESEVIEAKIRTAIDDYRLWQKSRLGRDINPTNLIGRMYAAGALRVEARSPVFTAVGKLEVARETAPNIIYGGLTDD
ncbi:baseplate J/gp47 family protein [Paenibacillus kribbensis]|uniref:baseplate assembly protein n=1 Tax=Paenibacillus kribbensis TaxID=172713 RepID=UPI002DBCCD48|nr:baseplate J/gp47 family protein [Paenibacillus kribbensis]MEC0234083.1 baseplate J/gp47 family protein [Paenibacillus kribbensis]